MTTKLKLGSGVGVSVIVGDGIGVGVDVGTKVAVGDDVLEGEVMEITS